MLQVIRRRLFAIAPVIIGLIALAFGFVGLNAYLSDPPIPHIAEVEGQPITRAAFQQRLQTERLRLQQMFGNQLPIDDMTLRNNVLDQLIENAILDHLTQRHRFAISDEQLAAEIRSEPQFQTNGIFDIEVYRNLLRTHGYSQAAYEAEMRQFMRLNQWRSALFESGFLTRHELQFNQSLESERRTITYAILPISAFSEDIEITDEAVQAHYEEHAPRYLRPERAKLAYIRLDLNELAQQVEISDAQLQQEYERQKDLYRQPEERRASHVFLQTSTEFSVTDAETKLAELKQRINDGLLSFEQAMAEINEHSQGEANDLGWLSRDTLDEDFSTALFAMSEANLISDPVVTSEGVHLIYLQEIRAEEAKPFEEVADELRSTLQLAEAEERFQRSAEQLQTLSFEQSDSLDGVSMEVDLPIETTDWVTATSFNGIMTHREVRDLVFTAPLLAGQNSDLLEISSTQALVFRVIEHELPTRREFEEVVDEIRVELQQAEARSRAESAAAEIITQLRDSEALDWETLIHQSGGQSFETREVTRRSAAIAPDILSAAFRVPTPPLEQAVLVHFAQSNGDQIILAVSAVETPEPSDITADILRAQSVQRGQTEWSAFIATQREQLRVKTFPERMLN